MSWQKVFVFKQGKVSGPSAGKDAAFLFKTSTQGQASGILFQQDLDERMGVDGV